MVLVGTQGACLTSDIYVLLRYCFPIHRKSSLEVFTLRKYESRIFNIFLIVNKSHLNGKTKNELILLTSIDCIAKV